MLQKMKTKLKDQQGMTLIELLAVIVILGIIAAIAIPSIMGIIGNTKKDAHIANAQQMVAAARNAVANGVVTTPTSTTDNQTVTLAELVTKQFMEMPDDPTDSKGYNGDESKVVISLGSDNKLVYTVTLKGNDGRVHINGPSTSLDRKNVTP